MRGDRNAQGNAKMKVADACRKDLGEASGVVSGPSSLLLLLSCNNQQGVSNSKLRITLCRKTFSEADDLHRSLELRSSQLECESFLLEIEQQHKLQHQYCLEIVIYHRYVKVSSTQ